MPVAYAISFLVLARAYKNSPYVITLTSFVFLLFAWSVLNPLVMAFVGEEFTGKRYDYVSIDKLILSTRISAYSIIISSVFVALVNRRSYISRSSMPSIALKLRGNKYVYYVYIMFAVVVLIVFGRDTISIFGQNELVQNGQSLTGAKVLSRQVIWVAIVLLFLIVTDYCKNRYYQNNNRAYFYLALLLGVLLISTVVGGRRSVQIFTGLVTGWILLKYFPREKRKIIYVLISAVLITFSILTIARFSSNTYYADNAIFTLDTIARYFQVYFGGVDSIASPFNLANIKDLTFLNLLFDIFRSVFGPSFILRNYGVLTSEIYNHYLYFGQQKSGQLIFGASYGYLYFGVIGSPIPIIANLCLAFYFEKLLYNTRSIEAAFLFAYCLVRVSTNLLVNTPSILTIVSMQFGTLGLLILVARLLNQR